MAARLGLTGCVAVMALVLGAAAPGDLDGQRLADQQALAPLQALVGQWRGVGQPQRGSNRGAWTEESDWAWRFSNKGAVLAFSAPSSQLLVSGELATSDQDGEFVLLAQMKTGQKVRYLGRRDEHGVLTLFADDAPVEAPARLTLRFVADGKRLVVLHERRTGADRFTRLAEVGYTRKGSGFGQGASFIECIVTGGLGTIPVTHQGKTYYVCCTGCRDLFQDDPEGVLADYETRKAEERSPKQ
jgi:hypothetical protein